MDTFEWLKNPRGRRSALATVHTAVRAGWMDGPEMAERRAGLVDALVQLMDDPTLRPAETLRICRIFASMERMNLAMERLNLRPIRLSSARGHRSDRMIRRRLSESRGSAVSPRSAQPA